MKRFHYLICALACLFMLTMSGCGNDKPATPAPASNTNQPAASAPAQNIPSVWVSTGSIMDSAICRIDPATNTQLAKITHEGSIRGISATKDAVWFSDFGVDTAVRIDPATNKVVAKVKVISAPAAILATPTAVWVASTTEGNISRIDPATNQVVATIPVTDVSLSKLAFVDNMLWVTGVDFTVYQIDPQKNQVVAKIKMGNMPVGITGKPGALWVSMPMASQLVPIDIATKKTGSLIEGADVRNITLTTDGIAGTTQDGFAIFTGQPFTQKKGSGTPNPNDIAFGFNSLWITSSDNNALYRVDPATQQVTATVQLKLAGKVAVTPAQ